MKNDNFVLKEDEEYLDFEADEKVANEIDEMLDFTILPDHAPSKSDEFKKLVDEKASNSETITEIDANNKEIITYKPSIKDFNIKNVKTKKLVHKAMVYTIIFMLAIFELFVANTGSVLSGLKIYAADNKPIRIVQNDKYGYIDLNGEKLISPKYTYGENFIKDYAIVKNTSNLPLIIDKGGKEVVPTGTYFSIYRAESNIIASKATKSGLKYGVLTSTLKTLVPFKYDNISYVGKGYSFTRNDVVGIINEMGKEVYTVKTTNKDNKIIEVFPSEVSSNKYERYAVVKVNSSSVVINLNDGTEVSKPTLNLVTAEKNNVFYETQNNNKKYFYVQNNKVLLESEDYASLTIDSIETGVLKALTKNYSYEFISTKSLEQFEKKLLIENTYYGENVFIYSNYKNHKTNYNLVKGGEVLNTIDYIKKVESSFKNGYAIVRLNDDTFNYINEDGKLLSDEHYLEAKEFDEYGNAIIKTDSGYGVINKDGKLVTKTIYSDIIMASSKVKMATSISKKNIFYAVKENNKYVLLNKKGNKINNEYYGEVKFEDDYPLVKVSSEASDNIIISESYKQLELTSYNNEYKAYKNYIIIKNNYYNYEGQLIYVDNRGE